MSGVATDPGAPLGLYEVLEPAGEPELIHAIVREGEAILDLGCGTGRITHALLALGRRVVAVDMDPEMLERVSGTEKVQAHIEDLDLGRTFGGVLLMSNLVNTRDDRRRAQLLASCRRHVSPGGTVVIQRYDPEAGLDPTPSERVFGGVTIRTTDIRREGPLLSMTIEYDAGTRGSWRIRLEDARILSDDELLADLGVARLRFLRWLDPARRWLAATPF